jgi:hypothetical protein
VAVLSRVKFALILPECVSAWTKSKSSGHEAYAQSSPVLGGYISNKPLDVYRCHVIDAGSMFVSVFAVIKSPRMGDHHLRPMPVGMGDIGVFAEVVLYLRAMVGGCRHTFKGYCTGNSPMRVASEVSGRKSCIR